MANSEIEKTIKMIDQKIKSLENTKKVLIEEFGGSQQLLPLREAKGVKEKEEKRKDRIIRLLRDEGSLSSKEIISKTGFPRGTVNFVLNDKKTFYLADNKWHLVEQKGAQ
ncbi:MAG: hypothetical protein Q7T83_09600 [Thermodesulfovibrionales bacterium]|nr:hypothetical protein [Thermodesulfovibrionales bacterium]MDP3111341.1 hypothetical protein [Thermodesulfovibrionales bacterium]